MRESTKCNGKRNMEEACRKNAAGRITRMTCLVRGEGLNQDDRVSPYLCRIIADWGATTAVFSQRNKPSAFTTPFATTAV